MREIAARVDQDYIHGWGLHQRGRVGGQHANGVQKEAKGRQDLRGRL
jgi:hypothetical protein